MTQITNEVPEGYEGNVELVCGAYPNFRPHVYRTTARAVWAARACVYGTNGHTIRPARGGRQLPSR